MKNKLIKNVFAVVLFGILVILGNNINATSYSISNTNLTVGTTATISINGTGYAGKYTITTSNSGVASINSTSLFIDDQVASVIVTAKSVGSAVVTVTPTDVSSYNNPEESFTKSQSYTINVSNPVTNNNQTTNTNSNNNNTQSTITKSSNANLRTLVPEVEGLTPSFNPNVTNYTLTVPSTITNLNMSVAVEQSGAKYWIEGDENLQLGNNTVTITVTAPSGAKKTYTIIVTKAEDTKKANALLNSLVIEGYELSPEFSSEVFEYNIGKINSDVEKLNILTFTASDKAKVEIQGNEILNEGENSIKIVVTAEDGNTIKEYIIKYDKEAKPLGVEDETNSLEESNKDLNENLNESNSSNIWQVIKDNALLLLMYLVVLVEFVQIVYLYRELKKRDIKKDDDDEKSFEKYNIKFDTNEEKIDLDEQLAPELEENKDEIEEIPNNDEVEENSQEENLEEIENDSEITSKIKTIWDEDKPDFSEELNNDSEEESSSRVRGGRNKKNNN